MQVSFKNMVITRTIKCNEIIEDHVGGIQGDFYFLLNSYRLQMPSNMTCFSQNEKKKDIVIIVIQLNLCTLNS